MTPIRSKTLAAAGILVVAALALVGCSSSDADAAAESPQSDAAPAESSGPRGVSGTIAAVTDGLLQVQSESEQTAVSYTADTTITRQIEASLSDVTAGVCITGIGETDAALSSVAITAAVDGACTLGFGGGDGAAGGPGGSGGELPEGAEPPGDGEMPELPEGEEPPEGGEQPSGGAPGGMGGFAVGLVTAVNGSTLTVETVSTDGEAETQDLTVDEATAYTKTEQAGAEALTVGACVVATGEYDGEEYAATSLVLSTAGDDGCTTGFGGAGGPGSRGQGQGSGQSQAQENANG